MEPEIYDDGSRMVLRDGNPTEGDACARYLVRPRDNPEDEILATIKFQPAPIPKVGVIGVTNEVLLAIVVDRLTSFQAGPFPSPHNESALMLVRSALQELELRTRDRQTRGVEGETKP